MDLHILDTEYEIEIFNKWPPCVASFIFIIMFSRFIHVVGIVNISFRFLPEWYSIVEYSRQVELSISWWKFGLFLLFNCYK